MKYFSDKTKAFYSSAEECEKAEKKYDKEEAAKKKAEEEAKATRKARAAEVEEAYKVMKDAEKHYNELVSAFIEDYKSYHISFSNTSDFVNNIVDNFFKIW